MMQNDPELDGKYLGTISKDFVVVSDTLREASYEIRKRGFSKFPIFPISKTDVPIGKLLIDKSEVATEWNYHITYMDEFVQLGIIENEKTKEFESIYKDPILLPFCNRWGVYTVCIYSLSGGLSV